MRVEEPNFIPNFLSRNFVPVVRMYDLEVELAETITQRLRVTFPIIEHSVQP